MSEEHIYNELPPKTPALAAPVDNVVYQYWKNPGAIFNEYQVTFTETVTDDGPVFSATGFLADEEGDRMNFATTDPDDVQILCEDSQYIAMSMDRLDHFYDILAQAHKVIQYLEAGKDPALIPSKFYRDE